MDNYVLLPIDVSIFLFFFFFRRLISAVVIKLCHMFFGGPSPNRKMVDLKHLYFARFQKFHCLIANIPGMQQYIVNKNGQTALCLLQTAIIPTREHLIRSLAGDRQL